ncbi:AtpZ/AtpI family protein [Thetidibacter halocola]|uniref:AtpZ/AtpI family protein n=1 Tax=Thetidibacter halocola TaxID=2827239 RepID=A0A8J7WEA7_9RHOB|nr:AtpZ/AtpI family protein [Thetidibacter halocola]MBS0126020.1 AtpZ/AtpI family protein [Thetidibacter halocola]
MNDGRTEDAARKAHDRERAGRADPEPSLARRFGQIGVLGWMIVIPILLGTYAGSWLDRWLGTGITFSAALLLGGAALGLWLALRWMHEQ